jgi:heat shock protein HtpX
MQAKEVTPADGGVAAELYHMVDDLRQRANLPMPRVYICPQAAPNAFATGRSPSKAAVAVTQGALQILNYDELKGVMAHELAHVKNRDTLTSCIAAMVAGTLAYLAQMGLWFGGGNNREGGNPLFGLLALILAPIGAAIIQAMISRSREYVADADGAAIAGDARGLMSALRKLESLSSRIPMDNPNPAQNNLFIVEPFAGKTLTSLFATHPPMEKRLASLAKVQQSIDDVSAGRRV